MTIVYASMVLCPGVFVARLDMKGWCEVWIQFPSPGGWRLNVILGLRDILEPALHLIELCLEILRIGKEAVEETIFA
jgi:hypothetical protein